jgi:putative DNA primase/helicase
MLNGTTHEELDTFEEELSTEELEALAPRCTDSANVDAFVGRHGTGFRFVVEWNKWLAWNGQRWVLRGADGRIVHAAMLSAREDYAAAKAQITILEEVLRVATLKADVDAKEKAESSLKWQKRLLAWHEQSQNSSRLNACVQLLATRLTLTLDELDACPWLLCVQNGTVDLRTAELLPHTREHYLTQRTDVEWSDDARCPTWDAFLMRAMGGDRALVLYLQRLVGYSCTALTTEQLLVFLYGTGSNGKSTFMNVLKDVLGQYACAAPRDLLMVQKTPKHETEFARLLGKRVATGAEVGDGQRFDEAKIKDLTGSDVIPARRMNEDFWDLRPTHKLWLAGNYKPTILGADHGIWRRIRLIPWAVLVDEQTKDRDLPAKLKTELPGILRWAVAGCLEWQRIGLREPESVVRATETYRRESDVLGAFLAECCALDPAGEVSRLTLRERYERWCSEAGYEPVGARRLAGRLRESAVVEIEMRENGAHRRGWRGLRLLTPTELYLRAEPTLSDLS